MNVRVPWVGRMPETVHPIPNDIWGWLGGKDDGWDAGDWQEIGSGAPHLRDVRRCGNPPRDGKATLWAGDLLRKNFSAAVRFPRCSSAPARWCGRRRLGLQRR